MIFDILLTFPSMVEKKEKKDTFLGIKKIVEAKVG